MLKGKGKILTVTEHQSLKVGQVINDVDFDRKHLDALERFYGEGVPYFSLIHNGVKFNEFVGVLQVGQLTIEVLPKADRDSNNQRWREVLLGMLRVVGVFDIHAPSSSSLSLKSNSILDIYFELFIMEVESLLHRGLVKRYRKKEGNLTTLKGSIQFSKHIRTNIVHKEMFYVKHTVYDHEHLLNMILFKALRLIQKLNTNAVLSSRIGALLLNFPDVPDLRVSKDMFKKIAFDRKTESYKKAIDIARLLLLNYHPDVRTGVEDVLAIMFDMNVLWERFVYRSLWRFKAGDTTVEAQNNKDFWKPERGAKVRMRPDIVINRSKKDCVVLDTKWKYLNDTNPSPDDLRQMYVYSDYFSASTTALIYPGDKNAFMKGLFYDHEGVVREQSCGIFTLEVDRNIRQWQQNIASQILK